MKIRRNRTIKITTAAFLLTALVGNAAVTMIFTETGSGVTLTSTGSFNPNHFIFITDGLYHSGVMPSIGFAKSGGPGGAENGVWKLNTAVYGSTGWVGSSPFGSSSNFVFSDSGSGFGVGIRLDAQLFFLGGMPPWNPPFPFTSTANWTGATFSSLGLVVGTLTNSWGSGADADSWTVAAVPEPSGALMCFVGVGASIWRRRRS
jgi:hypothetical protein